MIGVVIAAGIGLAVKEGIFTRRTIKKSTVETTGTETEVDMTARRIVTENAGTEESETVTALTATVPTGIVTTVIVTATTAIATIAVTTGNEMPTVKGIGTASAGARNDEVTAIEMQIVIGKKTGTVPVTTGTVHMIGLTGGLALKGAIKKTAALRQEGGPPDRRDDRGVNVVEVLARGLRRDVRQGITGASHGHRRDPLLEGNARPDRMNRPQKRQN